MLDWIFDVDIWASLLTLTALEIVLGIDNVIFISVVTARLPVERQKTAQRLGLALALFGRVVLLASLVWIIGLTQPLFVVGDFAVSWRDIILIAGGLFLLAKGTMEIHDTVEGSGHEGPAKKPQSYAAAIGQILVLDIVFSIDSVITAVGMSDHLPVMIAAVVIAILVMLLAAGPVSTFIQHHPTSKMLALSFLLLVGMALVADGLHYHVPRGYLYFAIAFSAGVEALNLWSSNRRKKPSQTES
ncbi:TerC family protein [Shumkonia mesophila]|uniref:TerC family protein n=1 Tax=Shumkonia mesophila TaxID=2838854 RepID=UPI002934346F|nr:TerC family protein [Shumkonia mesophila]